MTGTNLKLAAASGGIGAAGAALRIAAGTLHVQTAGGSVFLTSPNNGVTFAGTGVNVGGGLTLAAGGPIRQTAAIHTGTLNISTTSGAITLTNGDNGFGALTVATSGSATTHRSSTPVWTVASAHVGGTLTPHAGGAGQPDPAPSSRSPSTLRRGGPAPARNHAEQCGNAFGTLTVATDGGNAAS